MTLSRWTLAALVIDNCRDISALYPGVSIEERKGQCVWPVHSISGTPTAEFEVVLKFEEHGEHGQVVEQRFRSFSFGKIIEKLPVSYADGGIPQIYGSALEDFLREMLFQTARRLTGAAEGYRTGCDLLLGAGYHLSDEDHDAFLVITSAYEELSKEMTGTSR
jgi:hypothetical protein